MHLKQIKKKTKNKRNFTILVHCTDIHYNLLYVLIFLVYILTGFLLLLLYFYIYLFN